MKDNQLDFKDSLKKRIKGEFKMISQNMVIQIIDKLGSVGTGILLGIWNFCSFYLAYKQLVIIWNMLLVCVFSGRNI
jgi:hypothetical protein